MWKTKSLFSILEKERGLACIIEQRINFTQGCFAPSLIQIGNRFLNVINVILPLSPSNFLYPRIFWAKLVEIDSVVLDKKMKMWKVYENRTHFDQKSSIIWTRTWIFGSPDQMAKLLATIFSRISTSVQ